MEIGAGAPQDTVVHEPNKDKIKFPKPFGLKRPRSRHILVDIKAYLRNKCSQYHIGYALKVLDSCKLNFLMSV